jgi:hypothetical protein
VKTPEERFGGLKRKLNKQLQKPIGHRDAEATTKAAELELHAPMPETHGQGAHAIESEQVEKGKVCPACQSPAHAHDTKCPWCGAALRPKAPSSGALFGGAH